MSKIPLSEGIKGDFNKILNCFNPIKAHYSKGETIEGFFDPSYESEKIGIIEKGRAYLYCADLDGRYSLLEIYLENDMFGKIFLSRLENLEYIIVADTDCDIIFLDYYHSIRPCEKQCAEHGLLLSNLFRTSAHKAEQLALHTNILSCRTIRGKLTAYFKYISGKNNSFTIPMRLSELADYLCVDRSAMMRELGKMRDEGIINSKGKTFTWLTKNY
ncbi:MAG: Crp/Fnr family transcriptional regulator [Bacillota bacterium]|nr:Crp/Fnr family transcriptional regulator [Bacillota bacterium]